MEIRWVKIGSHYINVIHIEGLSFNKEGIFLSTTSGQQFKLTEKPTKDDTFAVKRIVRKINEKAYDVIYIEDFIANDEAFREKPGE